MGCCLPKFVREPEIPDLKPADFNRSCDTPRRSNMAGKGGIRSAHLSCQRSSRRRFRRLHFHERCRRLKRRLASHSHIAGRYRIAGYRSSDCRPTGAGATQARREDPLPSPQRELAIIVLPRRTEVQRRNASRKTGRCIHRKVHLVQKRHHRYRGM